MVYYNKKIVQIKKKPFYLFEIDNFFDLDFYLDIKKIFPKVDPNELSLQDNFGKKSINMVLYALQERKSQVLLVDLQVDSIYNSYKYTGLPPTPISGFGERSIMAVLETPETDFIYYLLTDKNGKMSFTNDYSDFINMKNKAKEEGVIP